MLQLTVVHKAKPSAKAAARVEPSQAKQEPGREVRRDTDMNAVWRSIAVRAAMSIEKITFVQAHRILAKLIELGVVVPNTQGGFVATARSEEHQIQVVVTVCKYEGPMRIHHETLAKIEAMNRPRVTPTMQLILAALQGQPARKAAWIAAKINKKPSSGGFRQVLADMVRFGMLLRGPDGWGYVLPPASST